MHDDFAKILKYAERITLRSSPASRKHRVKDGGFNGFDKGRSCGDRFFPIMGCVDFMPREPQQE